MCKERIQGWQNWIKTTQKQEFLVKREIFHANILIRFEGEATMPFCDKEKATFVDVMCFSWSNERKKSYRQ